MEKHLQRWKKRALGKDDVSEKVACAGTAIEQASFKVGKKSFLFLQAKDGGAIVRLKLRASIEVAEKDDHCEIGKGGWVTLRYAAGDKPKRGFVDKLIDESYAISTG